MPINEDKILILQELLPLITKPKAASDINHYDDAVRDWNTNRRLFKEAGGEKPTGDAERLAFTKLLLPDVAAHVTATAHQWPRQGYASAWARRHDMCELQPQRT